MSPTLSYNLEPLRRACADEFLRLGKKLSNRLYDDIIQRIGDMGSEEARFKKSSNLPRTFYVLREERKEAFKMIDTMMDPSLATIKKTLKELKDLQ